MKSTSTINSVQDGVILVLGGTGKTGSRIAQILDGKGIPTRIGSRSAVPAFDWNNETNWDVCMAGVEAAYINYAPDLAIPGAAESIQAFVDKSKRHNIRRLVLLSGRGEAEAQACERIVQDSGLDWTIVRASWFNQNFSEGAFVEMVQAGQITLPAADTPEPFVDVDDIADIAVAALTEQGHAGEVYEVTGPQLLTFAEAAAEISRASRRTIAFNPISHELFVANAVESGAPGNVIWMLDYLFSTVLDGRNSHTGDGVQRALGRPPKKFSDYAGKTAATGVWSATNEEKRA